MQRALAEASITGCDQGSSPVEYSESLAPSFFIEAKLRTYPMRYIVWTMCSYAFCLSLQNHVAVGKRRKVKITKKEQPTTHGMSGWYGMYGMYGVDLFSTSQYARWWCL